MPETITRPAGDRVDGDVEPARRRAARILQRHRGDGARALAPESAVNCVAPGTIDAGDGKETAAFMERVAGRTPMRRNGTVEEVASAVMYFATASRFITGQIMNVDGGFHIRKFPA